jgi:hypothetical protein
MTLMVRAPQPRYYERAQSKRARAQKRELPSSGEVMNEAETFSAVPISGLESNEGCFYGRLIYASRPERKQTHRETRNKQAPQSARRE